jgi:hypothetical protein
MGYRHPHTRIEENKMKITALDSPPDVSTFRLYVLRAMYAFMFVGLALTRWPGILNPPPGISNAGTVVGSVLGAISLLALLGIRYPLKMLPLLFFELLWKLMWVLMWGLPLWSAQELAPDSEQTLISALVGVVLVPLAVPWGYVFKQYVKAPGDRWGKQVNVSAQEQPSSSRSQATTNA